MPNASGISFFKANPLPPQTHFYAHFKTLLIQNLHITLNTKLISNNKNKIITYINISTHPTEKPYDNT
ncbi:hypothetical protein EBI01_07300 [Marinomonas rhizomae]|uniref:Uncharacterized protein n=1 Tax=Marinomonas rhizomae TaxID=491948 RepID=A0A366JBC9_9GAMM|nr:hypothetical protein DFP80_106181 [Marinomonas rhizomae]RNF74083.1 hypothetical protein EBI01_07300 [Marinomonas rhizomae]